MQVTLTGPVNMEQLFKIQEVLRHPSQYRDKIPPNEQPVTGDCTKSLNKSDAEVAEAIDIYKALGDDIPYGPENQSTEPPQQD